MKNDRQINKTREKDIETLTKKIEALSDNQLIETYKNDKGGLDFFEKEILIRIFIKLMGIGKP